MSSAKAINDAGQIAGWSAVPTKEHPPLLNTSPVLWEGAKPHALMPRNMSEGRGIDDAGEILITPCYDRPFVRVKQSAPEIFPTSPSWTSSDTFLWRNGKTIRLPFIMGFHVTAKGLVLGIPNSQSDRVEDQISMCAVWHDGQIRNLKTGLDSSQISTCLNDHGQGVGLTLQTPQKVFVLEKGNFTHVPIPSGFKDCFGPLINQTGHIIFNARRPMKANVTLATEGFLWFNGKLTPLGSQTTAVAINDHAQIIGWGPRPGSSFMWEKNRLVELSSLLSPGSGWREILAAGINNKGQIVGSGLYHGVQRAFVMTPTQ